MEQRIVEPADAAAITETVALAFLHDPVWGPALARDSGGTDHLVPFWRFLVESAVRHGHVSVASEGTTRAATAAVWLPPDVDELTADEEEQVDALMAAALTPASFAAYELLWTRFEENHPHDRPHMYLSLLATHPDHGGPNRQHLRLQERRIDARRGGEHQVCLEVVVRLLLRVAALLLIGADLRELGESPCERLHDRLTQVADGDRPVGRPQCVEQIVVARQARAQVPRRTVLTPVFELANLLLQGELRAQRLLRDVYAQVDDVHSARRFAFDMLVVDEAHHVAPSSPSAVGGGRGYAVDSQRTIATRDLAKVCEHRLFLSATPHNGHSESFTALLKMIDNRRFSRGATLDEKALADYRETAPHARDAHPTDEHFLPLHVAFGAAGAGAHGRALHRSFTLGNLSMAAYAFA